MYAIPRTPGAFTIVVFHPGRDPRADVLAESIDRLEQAVAAIRDSETCSLGEHNERLILLLLRSG
jgi:hypothetical protein